MSYFVLNTNFQLLWGPFPRLGWVVKGSLIQFWFRERILRVSIHFLAKTYPPSFNWIFWTADIRLILFLPLCLLTQIVYKKVIDSWPRCTCTALSAAELWILKTIFLKFNSSDFTHFFIIRFRIEFFTKFS